jgi:hypothetical protein
MCLVGTLPWNIHHASPRDMLSSGRFALHDLSHFFSELLYAVCKYQVKALTFYYDPLHDLLWNCNKSLPWACGVFTDECTQLGLHRERPIWSTFIIGWQIVWGTNCNPSPFWCLFCIKWINPMAFVLRVQTPKLSPYTLAWFWRWTVLFYSFYFFLF